MSNQQKLESITQFYESQLSHDVMMDEETEANQAQRQTACNQPLLILFKYNPFLAQYFEALALFCCISKKTKEFKKAVDNLTVIYDMETGSGKPKFYKRKYMITSLELLYLLSNNQFVEFHLLLQRLPQDALNQKLIYFVIKLERSFSIGNYHQVINHAQKPPLNEMNVFLQKVNETIRYHMARSAEVSYKYINAQDAIKLFSLSSKEELQKFIRVQEIKGKEQGVVWKLEGNKLFFNEVQVQKRTLDSLSTMENLFQYANELERIV